MAICLMLGPIGALALAAAPGDTPAPFINTWLVAGPFDNDAANAGFDADQVGAADVAPLPDGRWRVFDDRVFSRNYDDYQDLHSYLTVVRGLPAGPSVMYAHTYVFSERAQSGELRMGADNEHRAFVNGGLVGESAESHPWRDSVTYPISLKAGWNRLLIKVGNQEETRLGFYARLCATDGSALPGLTYALAADAPLAVAHSAFPAAFREWPYAALDPTADPDPDMEAYLSRKPHHTAHASSFRLAALGGQPPYSWRLIGGELPPGLSLSVDGLVSGTVPKRAPLGDCALRVAVTDAAGARAEAELTLPVHERPNRWYEDARLVGLMHNPESILQATDADLDQFADLMKRQGYVLGMMISYNNGDFAYRWPSSFEPDNPRGDLAGRFKAALEAHGVKFGMYMGNLIGPNHGGDNGAIRMVEEALVRYKPAAFWFDWASPDPDGYTSLDALYSMIRARSPETVIVLNGVQTLYQGDWDVVCVEGWGAWGDSIWATWPFELKWPKRVPVETWRLIADPAFDSSKDITPDWEEYLRVQLTIIGQGFVANMDHSPTIATPYHRLSESVVAQAHMRMADWANPPGVPPLCESYTNVSPGPVRDADWGYTTVSLAQDVLYIHVLENPFGKTGMPRDGSISLPCPTATEVRWMNQDKTIAFRQDGGQLVIPVADIVPDPVDTILKVTLEAPLTDEQMAPPPAPRQIPPGNLATHKPAKLLSTDGTHSLIASAFAFARYGVDGYASTVAQGAYEWAWMYEVDLEQPYAIRKVAINFGGGWATEYKLHVSADGLTWNTVAHVTDCTGGRMEHDLDRSPVRYVRVEAVKPDGPGQEGVQMAITELEAYE